MKLLFIQGGSRVQKTFNNNFYVDTNFNNEIWKRYKSYCANLIVILRESSGMVKDEEISNKLNKIDTSLIDLKLVPDIYKPKLNYLNIKLRKKIKSIIKKSVKASDRIIIRSIGTYYTNVALHYCKKYNKKYMIEVTGFGFDTLWQQGVFGKLTAIPVEIQMKNAMKNAPYVVYVTKKSLQKKYPCKNKTLGCSDSEIDISQNIIEIRKNRIDNKKNHKLILGTAAGIDIKFKGQADVIRALSKLKQQGINNFEYQLVGNGTGRYLKSLIKKYNLEKEVKLLGVKPHDQINDWLDNIDIYVHPSYIEGLSRSILEAMSRGCLVLAANVGGNGELINDKYLFKKKNYKQLAKLLANIQTDDLKFACDNNIEKSKLYDNNKNNKIRYEFYSNFINDD